MIPFFFVLTFTTALANDLNLNSTIKSLDDYSGRVNLKLNSFPGINEKIINEWTQKNSPTSPFFVKQTFGAIAGTTDAGTPIKAATIYVVNPLKKTGFLWWKKVAIVTLAEPDWTLFRLDSKPLKEKDLARLNDMFK